MNTPEKSPPQEPKKVYRSPIIHYYGSIRAITASLGMTAGASDGMGNNKTRP